jgi:hypothetical protein
MSVNLIIDLKQNCFLILDDYELIVFMELGTYPPTRCSRFVKPAGKVFGFRTIAGSARIASKSSTTAFAPIA